MEILNNSSLRSFNTFGIEQRARHFAKVASTDALKEALSWAKKTTSGP